MSTYTEEEAKTKWCPFVRQRDAASAGVTAINRHSDGRGIKCIASGCMAWRFESQESYDAKVEAWEDAANIGGPINRGPCPSPQGYCGLAGRPE